MNNDKMRQKFERLMKRKGWSLRRCKGDPNEYWCEEIEVLWQFFQSAYRAGWKAGQEEIYKLILPLNEELNYNKPEDKQCTKKKLFTT